MTTTRAPRVTVAVPLYRSARFVDNISANIDVLTYDSIEILISDRHGLDDAIDQLERRYGADRRFRFLRASDGIDWAAHYNVLLQAATGTYFCCMPHDDSYPPLYVDRLVASLEANPSAILACGVTHLADAAGARQASSMLPPPVGPDEAPSVEVSLRLLLFWGLFFTVHGVFRRDVLMRRGLLLPRMHKTVFADICWAFAMTLHGRVQWVPDAACTKRFHRGSASSGWKYDVRQAMEECRVMSAALWASPHPRIRVVRGIATLVYVAVVRTAWRSIRTPIGLSSARGPNRARTRAFGLLWRWLAPADGTHEMPPLHVGRRGPAD